MSKLGRSGGRSRRASNRRNKARQANLGGYKGPTFSEVTTTKLTPEEMERLFT